jgi:RNA polymerase sigma factor (sigma-70 family)
MSDEALRRLLPLVRRTARRLCRRLPANVELDDMVQAGLIAVSDALPRYDPTRGASIETFAARRALGGMLDELRRGGLLSRDAWRTRRENPEQAWPDDYDPADPAPGPLAVLLERERLARVEVEIARLPARSRDVLRLLLDGDLTGDEIGAIFGISPSRVSQIASEAVALLASRLAAGPVIRPATAPAGRVAARSGSLAG